MSLSYENPASRVIPHARVQAFRPPLAAPPPSGFRGGVGLSDSADDQRMRHSRYFKPVDWFDIHIESYEETRGAFAYFGPIYDHFGHFMAEMVHRALYTNSAAFSDRFIAVPEVGSRIARTGRLPEYLKQILQYLDIDLTKLLICPKDIQVDELYVCEQGSDFGGGPKDGYLELIKNHEERKLSQLTVGFSFPEKIFVSRSKVRSGGKILGEQFVEEVLKENGFFVLYPEDYSFEIQLMFYRSAKLLVITEGSACHGFELIGSASDREIFFISRRDNHREIFRRVLSPRSKEFHSYSDAKYIGSAYSVGGSFSPLEHLGLSVINPNDFLYCMRLWGINLSTYWSTDRYNDTIKLEIERYKMNLLDNPNCIYLPQQARMLGDIVEIILKEGPGAILHRDQRNQAPL